MSDNESSSLPLSRFTVLDLTRVRAGPTCTRVLGDWGADVIKIEPPGAEKEIMGGPRHDSDFQNLNRNKRSLSLDLKNPEGKAVFLRMVEKADVVVENFRPEVKIRLGIDFETLQKINPRLVYGSLSGFGQTGPYRDRPGFDQIAQGLGGLMSITGLPGQGPVRTGIPVADLCAGHFCAQGILVALLEREGSGQGQWVQTSLLEAMISMLDFQAVRWLVGHEVPPQAGNNHPTSIPTGVYKVKDGYINIATTGQEIWERFCKVIGAGELLDDPGYRTGKDRSDNRDKLNARLAAYLIKENGEDWIALFNESGVPCGPIYGIDEVFENEQVRHLGMAQSVNHPVLGELALVGQPISLSRTPTSLRKAAPELGEDNETILREMGLTGEEIEKMKKEGII